MITFLVCTALIIVAYFTYGSYTTKTVEFDENKTAPAIRLQDGVDYIPMPWYKTLLIQFLNIAGTGPIFGAISGALFGPVAFLWITFGTIFVGGVHDLISGLVSMKHDGASFSELIGIYLGEKIKLAVLIFSVLLLVLVGTVFITTPAGLLNNLLNIGHFHLFGRDLSFWIIVIILYYIAATVLPVDKVIGKIYPLFGFAMLFMAVGLFIMMMVRHFNGTNPMMELNFNQLMIHPGGLNPIPFLFITIACGAVSGFHATQSPMMARCLNNENEAKRIFMGSMHIEGVVALIWAAVAMAYYGGNSFDINALGGPAAIVNDISFSLLGPVGMVLAVLGVVAAPITSGDTAFRSARLQIADFFKMDQTSIPKRFAVAIPLFVIAIILQFVDFDILWRYFAWANQTLAVAVLWMGAMYLFVNKKNHWIASIPAMFMTFVSISFILQAPVGFRLPGTVGNIGGLIGAVAVMALFLIYTSSQSAKIYKDVEERTIAAAKHPIDSYDHEVLDIGI